MSHSRAARTPSTVGHRTTRRLMLAAVAALVLTAMTAGHDGLDFGCRQGEWSRLGRAGRE